LARAGFDSFEIHSSNEPFLLGPRSAIRRPKILGGQILRLLLRMLRRESIVVLAVSSLKCEAPKHSVPCAGLNERASSDGEVFPVTQGRFAKSVS
jgi:hypothetical protein